MNRPPLPPFTLETAQKVRVAVDTSGRRVSSAETLM
jgi:nuclear transport factor 2 (NTF2) superfamily protein